MTFTPFSLLFHLFHLRREWAILLRALQAPEAVVEPLHSNCSRKYEKVKTFFGVICKKLIHFRFHKVQPSQCRRLVLILRDGKFYGDVKLPGHETPAALIT